MTSRFAIACCAALASIASAGTINVPADYATIQDALDNAYDGDTILVAGGTYGPVVLWPRDITIKADPLPAQFTGMLGAKRGGAFAGDWNANGNVAPPKPHWPARSSTWLELGMPNATAESARPICTGFVTMMQVSATR